MATTLVLGGARSGKSAYAQGQAEAMSLGRGRAPILFATGQAFDAEMAARIARHQADRGERWITREAPIDLVLGLNALGPDDVAVVDCLTLWLSNLMLADQAVEPAAEALVDTVSKISASLWLVSNEVGLGIVPETPLGRRFRDEAGRLHQRLATVCEKVLFIAAGLPLVLK